MLKICTTGWSDVRLDEWSTHSGGVDLNPIVDIIKLEGSQKETWNNKDGGLPLHSSMWNLKSWTQLDPTGQ